MLEPSDRIWIIEKEFKEGGWITRSEIVIHHKELIPPPEDGWRVTEYTRVREDA